MRVLERLRERAANLRREPRQAAGVGLLLTLAATAPFPLGGVQPGGTFRIQLMSFLAAMLAVSGRSDDSRLPRPARLTTAGLLALGLLGFFQILPLSPAVVRALSPASLEVYSGSASVLAVSGGPAAPSPRISIAPAETRSVALLFASSAAAFLASATLLSSRRRRRALAAILLSSMAAQIAWGELHHLANERLSGPFWNPDHFAGYLGIGLSVAFGAVVTSWTLRSPQRGPTHVDRLERRLVRGAAGILTWAFVASALALTQSRGGMLAAAFTTLLLAGISLGARAHREDDERSLRRATLVSALSLGLLFVVATLGTRPLLRFLATDPRDLGEDRRVLIWTHSLDVWQSFPVFGSGLGTFREAFLPVQPRELTGIVEAAHGDLLQLLVTGGIVGVLLSLLAWVPLSLHLLRGAVRRHRREEGAFALAGLGALVTIALHGLVEFDLSIPAISVTLALVAGASVAALRDADRRTGRGPARVVNETTTRP